MPERNEEEQASFEAALRSIAEEQPLPVDQQDALSVLEGADVERFAEAWRGLPGPARARTIRALRGAAAEDLARYALLGELGDLHPALTTAVREGLLAALHAEQEAPGVRGAALAAL